MRHMLQNLKIKPEKLPSAACNLRLNVRVRLGRSHKQHEVTLGVYVAGTPRRSARVIGTVWARRA